MGDRIQADERETELRETEFGDIIQEWERETELGDRIGRQN